SLVGTRAGPGRRPGSGTGAMRQQRRDAPTVTTGIPEGNTRVGDTITLEGDANAAPHPDPSEYAKKFSGKYSHRTIEGGIGQPSPGSSRAVRRRHPRGRRFELIGQAASARDESVP